MELEVGKLYLCIKDVIMNIGEIRYHRGRCYKCEVEGCLTNERGNINHSWSTDGTVVNHFVDLKSKRLEILNEIL